MRIRLLAATVAALALAGCGAAAAPKAAPVAHSSSPVSNGEANAVFDQYAQQQGLTRYGDLATLEQGAHNICTAYSKDVSFVQVIAALTKNGWSGYDAGEMNGAAVAAYCPQYKDKAP